jgi:hypothetical protein
MYFPIEGLGRGAPSILFPAALSPEEKILLVTEGSYLATRWRNAVKRGDFVDSELQNGHTPLYGRLGHEPEGQAG